ncbi:hypothetical protein KKI90_22260 [Xenorhabdus bovienii]|uniref:hypothetical protein n=1 Tax=Xenorhabdus bovienii TaxID=40576 RepID=UPI00237C74D1|nr:hypothetical protein [Xenorhabdus bovienii]MDE1488951.1 hypothetical protein [Xenorhabdus bovienii]MDE9479824.1 hypothetical protein [Xenorhabdus bovienii]MDE9532752.1 hypothetical protein [Xenorhabdus bovienii]
MKMIKVFNHYKKLIYVQSSRIHEIWDSDSDDFKSVMANHEIGANYYSHLSPDELAKLINAGE